MNVEKINIYADFSGYNKPSNDELDNNNQLESNKSNTVNSEIDTYTSKKTYNFNSPVKIYAESVIKNAVKNIEKGLDVEENKKIIRIYSNIIKENPENILRNKFYI